MEMSNSEEVVNNLLNDLLKHQELTVSNIKSESGSKKGDNYVGIMKKIIVEGKDVNGKTVCLTYIVKQAPTDPKWRQVFQCEKCFIREIYMYKEVLPVFSKIEDDYRITNKLKYPKIYAISKIHEAETLIMEDLVSQKFEIKERRLPLNYEHCKIVMKYFAKLHSLSFILKKDKPILFEQLSYLPETLFTGEFLKLYKEKKMEKSFDRCVTCMDKNSEKHIVDKLKDFFDNMVENFEYCVDRKNSNGYNVICHADSWINNIFFKYQDEKDKTKPSEVCFIDWQLCRYASPVTDIFYFIYTSTDKKLRDAHLNQLFEEYYTSLASNLAIFNEKVENHFPKDEFYRHIKIFSKFGLFVSMTILQAILSDPKDTVDSLEIANNLEAMGEKMYKKALSDEHFKERMRGIILEMYDKGYI